MNSPTCKNLATEEAIKPSVIKHPSKQSFMSCAITHCDYRVCCTCRYAWSPAKVLCIELNSLVRWHILKSVELPVKATSSSNVFMQFWFKLASQNVVPPFLQCRASEGGAIYVQGSQYAQFQPVLRLRDSLVQGNNATDRGGGLWVEAPSTVMVNRTQIEHNRCVFVYVDSQSSWSYVYHHAPQQEML